jgi:hypothetical protein
MTKFAAIKAGIASLGDEETLELMRLLSDRLAVADPLHEDLYWAIIQQLDWSKQEEEDDKAVLAPAVALLSWFSEENIRAFANIQARLLWQLDGATYAEASLSDSNDYLSADGFLYKRCAVVASGKEVYYDVLRHPAKMFKNRYFESLLYLPEESYHRKTGEPWDFVPDYNYETYFNEAGWGDAAIKF